MRPIFAVYGSNDVVPPKDGLFSERELMFRFASTGTPLHALQIWRIVRIFFGGFAAAKIRQRIRIADFFRLIFVGQNSAANSDIRRRLWGLIQPFKRFTFWPISNLVS